MAGAGDGSTRLILLLDQLEELFTHKAASDLARNEFFELLQALACTGKVWVLATVRSDFYHHCQMQPILVRMKEGGGHVDLLPPAPDALLRLINGPAALAGLRFERDGEQSLDAVILREAADTGNCCRIIEHLLLRLCEIAGRQTGS